MSDQAPTPSRFDLRASTYEDSVLQEFLFDPVHQTVLRLGRRILPRAGAVLDVGCGTGRLLRAARPCYPAAELVGVDLAGQMVATASAVTPGGLGIRYVQARAERLPFPDGPRRDSWVRLVRRRRCSQASAELKALLTRQCLELAGLERVRWFGLPDVQVLGLQLGLPKPLASRSGGP